MRQFSSIKAIAASFLSGELYRDVARNWQGIGFGYLFLVVLLLEAIPMTWGAWSFTDSFMFGVDEKGRNLPRYVAYHVADQWPIMHLENGKVSVEGAQPRSIFIKEENEPPYLLAVIDTTGNTTSVRDVDARILITATEIQAKKSDMEVRSFLIKDLTDKLEIDKMLLDKQSVRALADQGFNWLQDNKTGLYIKFGAVLLLSLLLVFFLWRIVMALLLSIVASIASSVMGVRMEYADRLRLCAVALTPVVALTTVALLGGKPMTMLMFVIAIGYTIFAVRANRPEA